jgi:rhamnose transport system ATP-binding protein
LTLTGIRKSYGGVRALRGVDFEVRAGEVHALVGANGAGKSTLIRVISGAESADAGTVVLDGRELHAGDTAAALKVGIATVYQEPHLFGELTAVENVYIGRELTRGARVDWRRERAEAIAAFGELGIDAAIADVRAADLHVAQQQLVSIAKELARNPRVLILDEPSAILTDHDIDALFGVIAAIKRQGVGIIYISHRLDEIRRVADRVSVMRDGELVSTQRVADTSIREIAEKMVGKAVDDVGPASERVTPEGAPLLEVTDLGYRSALRGVGFDIAPGEILALYGLVGSGNDEVARALFGIVRMTSGTVRIDGAEVVIHTPRDAQRAGIGLLPADRRSQGVFGDKSIAFNIGISNLTRLARWSWVDRRAESRLAGSFITRLGVKAPGAKALISALSGGNQQKVVLARQLATQPRVLILQEPTQGVDVGAKAEIHRHVFDLAASGSAVLVVSTDLDEVLTLADRLLVMRGGSVVGRFGRGANSVDVLAVAAGDTAAADIQRTDGAS